MAQTSEELSLVRDDALDLATELEEVAAALRVIALGGAASDDVALLRANIDGRGLLLVGSRHRQGKLDWELLCQHASDELLEGAS